MTDTLTREQMADDQAPEGFELACPICGQKPGRGAGPNWLRNHAQQKHSAEERRQLGLEAPEATVETSPELTAAEKKLAGELEMALAMPTLMIMMVNPTDGQIIMLGTPRFTEALVLASRKSPQLKRFLRAVVEGVVWLALATAVADIVLPILDNHNIVSIPRYRVEDKLGGAVAVARPTPAAPERPAPSPPQGSGTPARPGPVTPIRIPGQGAPVPDMGAGMNRAARRAVEPPGPDIPPAARALMEQYGVTEADLEAAASQLLG